jgi:menaquinol-cytochrome c reductase iron-sulfur subunit
MAEPTQKEPGSNAYLAHGLPPRPPLPSIVQAGGGAPAPPPAPEERRGALKTLVVLGSVAYAGALAIPAARFLSGSVEDEEGSSGARERWLRVGRLADLPAGEPRRAQVIGDERDAFTVAKEQLIGTVWIVRAGDEIRAMSATCPHLGCALDLDADKKGFGCPCHASRFSLAGAPESGPSPRGMDTLKARIVDGWVEVDFRRFRLGVAERQEVAG